MPVRSIEDLLSPKVIRERREASIWTKIHPIFAIGQLGVFAVSVVLLVLYFFHVTTFSTVFLSVLIKIAFMIGAVVTGSFWEKDIYGAWWFAYDYFIEDVMTLNVFLLHIAFLVTAYAFPNSTQAVISMLLVAYGVYFLNVIQYIVRHSGNKKSDAEPSLATAA
jgi:3-vinyl bacteriochlorophyllide hydratase